MSTAHRHPLALSLSAALSAFMAANVPAQQTPAPASAQTPPQTTAADDSAGTPDPQITRLDALIVTGSRIPRAGFDTLEPATAIDEEYIESRGHTNIADALNEIPGFGIPTSPNGEQNAFGGGSNFVNLFGLGSQRTLTLVNGRRVVSANAPSIFSAGSPGVQVDLNTIPAQLVERIENISVGGAPTYGSDAIAGTTNVILKRDFEGVEASVTYGMTDRGDGERYNASALFGRNLADERGNITISASIDNQDGVRQIDRDFLADGFFFAPNPLASSVARFQPRRTTNDGRVDPSIPFNESPTNVPDGIPDNVLITRSRVFRQNPAGVLLPPTGAITFNDGRLIGFGPDRTTFLQFAPNGDIVPYDPGVNFGSFSASGGDGDNPAEAQQITSDLKRKTLAVLGRFAFTENIEAFFEGMYYKADAAEVIDSGDINSTGVGVAGAITIRNDYPLLSAQAADTLAANGITSFRLGRNHRDFGTGATTSESEMIRGVFGLTGLFELGDRTFTWEATANLGRYESAFARNQINQQNFVNAINVTAVDGQVVCSPTAVETVFYGPTATTEFQPVADPNCVPLNLFGEGAVSPEAVAYITDPTRALTVQKQQVYNINATGSLFDTWAGPVSINVGYEHRRESAEFTADEFQRLALGRSIPIQETQGAFSTDEVFAETLVPLVDPAGDLTLLKRLDLTGKIRRVDSTVNGGFTAYTYGFQWAPFETFQIRGNRTRSLRAPAITELFTPASQLFITVSDPCRAANLNGGQHVQTRQSNCSAFYQQSGITPPFTGGMTNIQGIQSGNPNLENEVSNAYTIGFVWEPIKNLRLAVDYIEIEIDQVISLLSANDVTTGCFDNAEFDTADVNRANQFCELITRDADGQITRLDLRYVNGEFLNFTGVTANLLYDLDLGDYGAFRFGATAYNPRRLENSNTGVTTIERAGQIGSSDRQYQFNVGYRKDRFDINWQSRYVGEAVFDNDDTIENRAPLGVGGYWLHNAGMTCRIFDNAELRLAVTNVFDAPPPQGALFGYDVLGRRYSVTAKWTF